MVTSKEIALQAEVDPSTVSKILSGATNFSDKTIEKVKRVCAKNGYTPDVRARSLRMGRSNVIAVHLPFGLHALLEDPFIPEFLAGVNLTANKEGYASILTYSDGGTEFKTLKAIRSRQADGIIVTSPRVQAPEINQLIKDKVPLVIGQHEGETGAQTICVDVDNVRKGVNAASFLVARRHRKVGIIAQTETIATRNFIEGFSKGFLAKAGEPAKLLIKSIPISAKEAQRATADLLTQSDPPTAIVTNLAVASFGMIEAVRNAASDCQLLASDSRLFRELHSDVCRIHTPSQELGSQMALALINLLRGKRVRNQSIMLQAEIIDEHGNVFSDEKSM